MPRYKYIANRFLTLVQNLLLGAKLSEYHTGYRAYDRRVLESLPILANSDDFVFDSEILTQAIAFEFRNRRDQLSDEVLPGSELDQLPSVRRLWLGRALDESALSALEVGVGPTPTLLEPTDVAPLGRLL